VADGGAGLTRGELAISLVHEAQPESNQGLAPRSEFATGAAQLGDLALHCPEQPLERSTVMKRKTTAIAILTLICLVTGSVSAQYSPYSPYLPPQANPYLNILRGGATPGQNFFALTRPQINYQAGINTLQQQTLANQQLISGLQVGGGGAGPVGPVTTGQAFGFQNHLAYFQNQFTAGNQIGFGLGAAGAGGTTQPRGGAGALTPPKGR
jgi:hypothetical protein